jgi:ABC-2 type transport system permease protein
MNARRMAPPPNGRAERIMANAPATPQARAAYGRGSLLKITARRIGVELRSYVREPVAVLFVFLYPLLMMLTFASVFQGERLFVGPGGHTTVAFAQYFLPGVVATAVVLSSVQLIGVQVAQDREVGLLKRLHGTPMPSIAYFLGLFGQVIVSLTLQITLLLVLSSAIWDVSMPRGAAGWATFVWVCAASAAAGTAAGLALGGIMPSARAANAFLIPFLLLLQFISGVFFSFQDLPLWMKDLSALFSLKWTAQGLRSVFLPEAFAAAEQTGSWQHGMTAIVLALWLLVWGAIALRTFRWLPRGER